MGTEGKGKGKGKGGVNQVNRRPFTRTQAKAMANPSTPVKNLESPPSSSNAISLSNSRLRLRSWKSAKRSEATTNITIKKLGKSIKKSIPTAEDIQDIQQSDQQSSSPTTIDLCALVDNILVWVPVKGVNVAAADATAPNIISSEQLSREEAVVETSVFEKWPRDNFGNSHTIDEGDEGLSQSHNLGLTEIVNTFADAAAGEEVESSAFKSALVPVLGYRVKEATAQILNGILQKHGDIAGDCTITTVESRSLLLEKLCDIMQELEHKKFSDVTKVEIENILTWIKALEGFKLDVGWLKKRLEDILEAKGVIQVYESLKEKKAEKCKSIQESKRALKWYKSAILEYESKILEYKAKILECESAVQKIKLEAVLEQEKLEATQAESRGIRERVENAQAIIELCTHCSVIQNLY
ncbi:hypothetical protein SLEP1_g12105 [Rubroshorea leprosula]|nr:hypothetical protein SLEP1_g12105 [Rubroshorea leprosula]